MCWVISFGGPPTSGLWGIVYLMAIVALGSDGSCVLNVVKGRGVYPPASYVEARWEMFVILSKPNVGDPLKGIEVSCLTSSYIVPDGLSSGVNDYVDGGDFCSFM